MLIRNKFSGYRFDGTRNCHDPVSAAALVATGAGELGTAAAAAGALGTEAAIGGGLASTALGGGLAAGLEAGGLMALAPGVSGAASLLSAGAPAMAATPGIMSSLSAMPAGVSSLASLAPAATATEAGGLASLAQAAPALDTSAAIQNSLAQAALPGQVDAAVQAPISQSFPLNDAAANVSGVQKGGGLFNNFGELVKNPNWSNIKDFASEHPYATSMAGLQALKYLAKPNSVNAATPVSYIRPYTSTRQVNPNMSPMGASSERQWFTGGLEAGTPYRAMAAGGITTLGVGGPVEQMSAQNAVGDNSMYPQAGLQTAMYSNPMAQRPVAENVIDQGTDTAVDPYTGEQKFAIGGLTFNNQNESTEKKYTYDPQTQQFTDVSPVSAPSNYNQMHGHDGIVNLAARIQGFTNRTEDTASAAPVVSGGIATPYAQPTAPQMQPTNVPAYQSPEQQLGLQDYYGNINSQLDSMHFAGGGGIPNLGGYSDGGHLLKGPGDGVSDSIPAQIGDRQPARLADGEFVVPARIVSELGNGSTEAGARQLYKMMARVQNSRKKSIGKDKVAVDSKASQQLPA